MHIVITDSGLGGLSICAGIERNARLAGRPLRLTYVNAWPDEAFGYNDLADIPSRAAVFDRALAAMAAMRPDRIVIACNTLSILYPHTSFSAQPAMPVVGILDAAVGFFRTALDADADSHLVLIGTKTTIESGEHRTRLLELSIAPARVTGHHCHGLAGAIERDPGSARVTDLIESCAAGASAWFPSHGRLFLGLCCTHYTYVADRLRAAAERHTGRAVHALDPNQRLADDIAPLPGMSASVPPWHLHDGRAIVTVVSKVGLTDEARAGVARLIDAVSPDTAAALLSYLRTPDLF